MIYKYVHIWMLSYMIYIYIYIIYICIYIYIYYIYIYIYDVIIYDLSVQSSTGEYCQMAPSQFKLVDIRSYFRN